jgi:hypothetical protein
MSIFPQNKAHGSLLAAVAFVLVDIFFAFLAGPDGAETPGWVWVLAGAVPIYGTILGAAAVWHKQYLGLLGVLFNILVILFLVFAIAWG